MKSNGFGSFIQTIVILVPDENAEEVASILGTEPYEIIDNQARFEWTRQTTRRGDDEDVVFDLSRELGFDLKWRIDWEKSDYRRLPSVPLPKSDPLTRVLISDAMVSDDQRLPHSPTCGEHGCFVVRRL